jgi:hypothetical protein
MPSTATKRHKNMLGLKMLTKQCIHQPAAPCACLQRRKDGFFKQGRDAAVRGDERVRIVSARVCPLVFLKQNRLKITKRYDWRLRHGIAELSGVLM